MSPSKKRGGTRGEEESEPTQPISPRDLDLEDSGRGGIGAWMRRVRGGRESAAEPVRDRAIERALDRVLPDGEERLREPTPIGWGGMALVERVFDRAVRRTVARKVLLPDRQRQLDAVKAFVREAQITGQLDHPNIVPVYDFGRVEDGRLFFTMKRLTGHTLAEMVGGLPPGLPARSTLFDLLEIVLKVCDALAFAHQRGVVHGDVKPENVMVGRFGQVYLVDWGLARADRGPRGATTAGEPVTTSFDRALSGRISGTPAYFAPEQAAGKRIDERTDVFGLGTVLYFVLARVPPYRDIAVEEVIATARRAAFPPLAECETARGLPRELARIVGRATARRPADRYQTVTELKSDLVGFLRGDKLPRMEFAAGAEIVREGNVGERAYVIVSGRCEVRKLEGGVDKPIRTLEAGECFGETAILAAAPRTASVIALEDTVVEYISGAELLEEVDAMKPWMGTLLRSLAERFRERETTSR